MKVLILFVLIRFAALSVFAQNDPFRLPARLSDIDGRVVAVDSLAQSRKLILVTVKASWCPVCREQLRRLREKLPEAEACGITFVVLGAGPAEELATMRGRSGAPFFFVEDKGLKIVTALGLNLTETEVQPALVGIGKDRSVSWMQVGRGPSNFGESIAFKETRCADWI